MMPRILYFDMGGVLLKFSHERQCRQIAEAAGVSFEAAWDLIYGAGRLGVECESGRIDGRGCYERLAAALGCRGDYATLLTANNDIFSVSTPIVPLVGALQTAGYRLGILSNTTFEHWEFVSDGRFAAILPGPFDPVVLSCQVGAMKPDAAIFAAAARRAGVNPDEVFYVDDMAVNVAGARSAGFDAVQYVGVAALAWELRRRGMTFNY